jgi:hypothetical protein
VHSQYRVVRLRSQETLQVQILFFGIVLGNTFDIGKPTDATVGAASLSTDFFVKNAQSLTSLSMAGSTNGALVGPITISGTITIPSGSTFVIL